MQVEISHDEIEDAENLTINQLKSKLVEMNVDLGGRNQAKKYYVDLYNKAIKDSDKNMNIEHLDEDSSVTSEKKRKGRKSGDESDKVTARKRKRDDEKVNEQPSFSTTMIKNLIEDNSRTQPSETVGKIIHDLYKPRMEAEPMTIGSESFDRFINYKTFIDNNPPDNKRIYTVPVNKAEPLPVKSNQSYTMPAFKARPETNKDASTRSVPVVHNIQIINTYRPDNKKLNKSNTWNNELFKREFDKVQESWKRNYPETNYNLITESISNTKICTEHEYPVKTININTIWKSILAIGLAAYGYSIYREEDQETYKWIVGNANGLLTWTTNNHKTLIIIVIVIASLAIIGYLLVKLRKNKKNKHILVADNCIQQIQKYLLEKEKEGLETILDADLFMETYANENNIKIDHFKNKILPHIEKKILIKEETSLEQEKIYTEGELKTYWKLK